MIEKPTLIRTIQMSDVRRRWGPFFAGAGAPAALTGVGSTATVGLDARMLPDRFCGDAVAALWGVLCVRDRVGLRDVGRCGRRNGEELVEVRHHHLWHRYLGHRQLLQRFQLWQRRKFR